MGIKGDSSNNALAETIKGLCMAELIHRRTPIKTKDALKMATLELAASFNHHRLLEPIGFSPIAEVGGNCRRQLAGWAATVAA